MRLLAPLRRRLMVLVRSAGVGGLATLVDLGALTLLVSGLGVDPRVASVPSLCLGIVVQFFGNKIVAFRDKRGSWLRQGAQFMGVEALGFIANVALFDLLVARSSFPYLAIRVVVTSLVYFGICLPLWSLIFTPSATNDPSLEKEQLS